MVFYEYTDISIILPWGIRKVTPSAALQKYLSSFVDTMKLGELGKLGKLGEILAVQLFLPSCTRTFCTVPCSLFPVPCSLFPLGSN
jgi:hypothetical protein